MHKKTQSPPVPETAELKKCSRCKRRKPISRDKSISQFYFRDTYTHKLTGETYDRYKSMCKTCDIIRIKEYTKQDHVREKIKKRRNSDRYMAIAKEYRLNNKEKRSEYDKRYRQTIIGKLNNHRSTYSSRLKTIQDESRRARLERTLAAINQNIERIKQQRGHLPEAIDSQ